jgi:NAD(P)-dependent dehydrogenase (short-subunit alcohol dehydrogenase family)
MVENLFDVSGSIVLVSGGSRGIGECIGLAFAERGANVIITGRDAVTIGEATKRINVGDGITEGIVCDVTDPNSIDNCVDKVIRTYGRIDTLINCAGVNIRKPVLEFTAEDYDRLFNVNLRGAFLMAQKVGAQMKEQGGGSQINIDSLSSDKAIDQIVPYSMSKAAMTSMSKGLASEWGKYGVRVNSLAPGFIMTELTQELWNQEHMQAWGKVVTPLQRMGQSDDLIGTAIFLASRASAFITGQVIRIDGGVTAGIHWPIAEDFKVTVT